MPNGWKYILSRASQLFLDRLGVFKNLSLLGLRGEFRERPLVIMELEEIWH
jgi:hypothetical protein